MSVDGFAETLLGALTAFVGLGGVAALALAAVVGEEGASLGTLYGALVLILAAMFLVAVELSLAVHDVIRSIALSVQRARDRREIERLERQRLFNLFAVELGYASAKGVPLKEAWDEVLVRCSAAAEQALEHPPAPAARRRTFRTETREPSSTSRR